MGRFLNITPILLHGGRSSVSLEPDHEDWWAVFADAELRGPGTPVALALRSQPIVEVDDERRQTPEVEAVPSPHQADWWGELVQQELAFCEPEQPRVNEMERAVVRDGGDLMVEPSSPHLLNGALLFENDGPEMPNGEMTVSSPTSTAAGGDVPAYSNGEDDGQPGQLTPNTLLTNLEDRLCVPMETPLIRGPPRLRRTKTPATQALRRSVRIASALRESNTTTQAQSVLLKKLGVAPPSPAMGPDTAMLCRNAFRQPLSDTSHDNLQRLLGGHFDPIAMNLNMLGLEDKQ